MDKNAFNSKAENEACKAQNYAEFGKLNLKYIREGVENILKLIGRNGIFDEYTLHDMTHIDAMLDLLDTLIPPETAKIMTPADWLLIVLSCYFHDLGMLVTKKEYQKREESAFPKFRDEMLLKGEVGTDYKDALSNLSEEELERFYYQEFVRCNHAERIFYWVTGQANEKLGASHQAVKAINKLLDELNDKLREDLALVCRSHHRDDLDQIDSVYVIRRAYAQPKETHANLQYAALMLRTADLLQIQSNRVPSIMYMLIDPANPKSQDEWAKQMKVRAVLSKKSRQEENAIYDTIEVQAQFDKASGFFGLTVYLQYAESELKQSAEWALLGKKKGAEHEFPWKYIDDSQVEAKGFLPQKYQFILDRKKILDLLTGHTLYNDSTVAIREILQNAIDAVRFQGYLTPNEALGTVEVQWNPTTRRLVVRDTGIGMTKRTIEDHLLNIGSSYYQEDKFKEKYPDFSPISKFGIGILSFFMISNDVQILTVHSDEERAYEVILPSATQRYLIKLVPKDAEDVKRIGIHGTQVSMVVRRSAELQDIERILRYWIVLPECEITLTVEGEEKQKVGFSSINDTLEYYINEYKLPSRLSYLYSGQIEANYSQVETDGGTIDIAYAKRYLRWFRVWDLVSRPPRDKLSAPLSMPPGVCVEGIRVSSDPPGYETDGVWAIANLRGSGSPRTNVARTDLEQTADLRRAYSNVYNVLASHIQAEFDRIVTSGGGITKAAIDADFMTDRLLYKSKYRDEVQKHIDALKIVTIEDESGRKTVSRRELRDLGFVWTVDGPLIDHIDGMCESMETKLSSREIIMNLSGNPDKSIPFPRLIGKRTSALTGLEIESIMIDLEAPSIAAKWTKASNRWHTFTQEEIDLADKLDPWQSEVLANTQVAIGRVECNDPRTKCVWTRGFTLFLPESAVSILWRTTKGNPCVLEWIASLARLGQIKSRDLPRFRADLESIGLDPDDILSKMFIKEDERFDLTSLDRSKWYSY